MCGRYGRITSAEAYAKYINAMVSPRLADSAGYNLPPGTFQPIVLNHPDTGECTIGPAFWGFIPNFKNDDKLKPINARRERAGTNNLFKRAYARQRCLIPADWWYEWQRDGNAKQPYCIQPQAQTPFFFAGVWSKAARLPHDHPAAGQVTFAILTGQPHEDLAHIHTRQPMALTNDAAHAWLGDEHDPAQLDALLVDGCFDAYESWPISKAVGSPENDGAEIIEPISV